MTAAVSLLTSKLDRATVQAVVAYRIALRTLDEHEAAFVDVSPGSREQHEERRVQLRAEVTSAHAGLVSLLLGSV